MKNLFLRPTVFFMLMVICLSPPTQTIQIQACPPDCSSEEAAVAEAQDEVSDKQDEVSDKKKDLEIKDENYRTARTELQNARKNQRKMREGLKKTRNKTLIRNVLDGTKTILGGIKGGAVGAIKGVISWGSGRNKVTLRDKGCNK